MEPQDVNLESEIREGREIAIRPRRGDNPLHLNWTRIGALLAIYVVWTPEDGIRQQLPVSRNGMVGSLAMQILGQAQPFE
jgi:hypothetical protein